MFSLWEVGIFRQKSETAHSMANSSCQKTLLPEFLLSNEFFGIRRYYFRSAPLFLLYSEPSIGGFFIFLTTAILSAGILVAIVVGVQSLAFFVGDTEELSGGFFHLVLAPSTYPPDIFTNSAIAFIFYSIVPVFFTTWLPFELIRSFNWIGLWILTVFTAFISGASYAIFRLGLKRYESGNLMNVRI
jgi:ABC-2 type transport system permease protein